MENKPVKKFVVSPIAVSVWETENEKDGNKFKVQSVTLQRSYKDKDGNWANTHNLRIQDLPKAILVLQKAFDYLATTELKE